MWRSRILLNPMMDVSADEKKNEITARIIKINIIVILP